MTQKHTEVNCIQGTNIELILQRIDELKKFKHQEHLDMKEVFDAKQSGLHAEMIANQETIHTKLDMIISRQDVANDRVSKTEHTIEDLMKDIANRRMVLNSKIDELEKSHGMIKYLNKYPIRTILVALGIVAVMVILVEYLGVRSIISMVK